MLEPLLDAPPAIRLHAAAALLSVAVGPVALFRRSRDRVHRIAGRIWIAAMLVTALSSFLIYEGGVFGPFSVIHILSALTLWGLWRAVVDVRAGRYASHGAIMRALYAQALLIAGAFTFLPGRRMSDSFFPAHPRLGFAIMLALGLGAAFLLWRDGRKNPLPFPKGLR